MALRPNILRVALGGDPADYKGNPQTTFMGPLVILIHVLRLADHRQSGTLYARLLWSV